MSEILQAFTNVKSTGDNAWMATCPAHDHSTPSLSIGRGVDGRWLLKCFSGCELDSILGAVNLERRDLFPRDFSAGGKSRRILDTWDT